MMTENARIPMFPQICTGDVETSNTKTESAAIIMDAMQIAFNFHYLHKTWIPSRFLASFSEAALLNMQLLLE